MKKVLFVCLGNICRSPTAHAVMQGRASKSEVAFHIDSAGTSGFHAGELPDARMRKHGAKRGYNLDSLSRQFVKRDFIDFDYIIVMDDSNYANVSKLCSNKDDLKKVFKMTDFCENYDYEEVPDPYYGGEAGFELVIDLIEDGIDNFISQVESGKI